MIQPERNPGMDAAMTKDAPSLPTAMPVRIAKPRYGVLRLQTLDDAWIIDRLKAIDNPAMRRMAIEILHFARPALLRGRSSTFQLRISELLDNPLAPPRATPQLGSSLLRGIASRERVCRLVNQLSETRFAPLVLEDRHELLDSLYARRLDLRILRAMYDSAEADTVAELLHNHTGLFVDPARGLTSTQSLILMGIYCVALSVMAVIIFDLAVLLNPVFLVLMGLFTGIYMLARSEYENEKAIALFISFTDEFMAGDEQAGKV